MILYSLNSAPGNAQKLNLGRVMRQNGQDKAKPRRCKLSKLKVTGSPQFVCINILFASFGFVMFIQFFTSLCLSLVHL